GQRFAHLGRIVVHGLEIDPGHPSQPVAVPCGIENNPPRPLWRAQCAVSAIFQRKSLGAEQTAAAAQGRNAPIVGRVSLPHVEPGSIGGAHPPPPDTPVSTQSRDIKKVHAPSQDLPPPPPPP